MTRYYKNFALKNAKNLRKTLSDAENILWFNLRDRRLNNIKFKRQVPIGKYIVDFLCENKKVIIELDGSQHIDNASYDKERDNFLKNSGYEVIRIFNNEITNNLNNVLEYINSVCNPHP